MGLIINGTLTKSPVAVGAQLVGYSGFSAANFLEMPYSSNLDFGTGDFSICGWLRTGSDVSTGQWIFHRADDDGSPAIQSWIYAGTLRLETDANGGALSSLYSVVAANTLYHVCLGRNSSGLFMYLNGVSNIASSSNPTVVRDVTSANGTAKLRVGLDLSGTYPFLGSLALLRLSATAMSVDQIAFAYRTELALFQPSAQCCIAGTSTAVTALSHDESTDLLQVGTSWGRTSFKDLVRVDSEATSTGAVTSISATGGAVITGGASSGRYYQPALTLREELRRKEEARKALGKVPVFFDFTGVTNQTTFVLPKGYTCRALYLAGALQRITTQYTLTNDGFQESIVFGTAPANGAYITAMATRV